VLALGGTAAKGLVVGAELLGASVSNASFNGGPAGGGEVTASFGELGFLMDWYPVPTGGWHAGGVVGVGGGGVQDAGGNRMSSAAFCASALGGYDWWIGPQWSLGLELVLSAGTSGSLKDSNGNDSGYSFTPLAGALVGSILFH
jgi:hypothetical protein